MKIKLATVLTLLMLVGVGVWGQEVILSPNQLNNPVVTGTLTVSTITSASGNLNLKSAGASAIVFNINGADVMSLNGNQLTPVDNTIALGDATHRFTNLYLSALVSTPVVIVGTSTATSGAIRLAYGGSINALNNVGSADIGLIQLTTIVGEVNTIALGGAGNNVTPGSANLQDLGRPSAAWRSVYAGTSFTVGTNPASAGSLRMPSGATGIVFRNNANNADLAALGSTATDVLTIGANYPTSQIGSGATFLGIGGVTDLFPGLKRSNATLQVRLGDDSGDSTISALYYIPQQAIAGVANVGANSCGTTAATVLGSTQSSVTTVGATSGTQCRLQFTSAATTAWDCTANDDSTTIAVRTTPVDTTHTDLIGAFTAGDKVTAHCWPR